MRQKVDARDIMESEAKTENMQIGNKKREEDAICNIN